MARKKTGKTSFKTKSEIMRIISNSELNETCLDLIEKSKSLGTNAPGLFYSLYNTGLRCNELLSVDRWEFLGAGKFKVNLLKNSGTREIFSSQLGNDIAVHIIAQRPFFLENHNHLQHFIRKQIRPILTHRKEVARTTHLFRYNFCRQMIEKGATLEDVQKIIKHSSTAITTTYCFSPLYVQDCH